VRRELGLPEAHIRAPTRASISLPPPRQLRLHLTSGTRRDHVWGAAV